MLARLLIALLLVIGLMPIATGPRLGAQNCAPSCWVLTGQILDEQGEPIAGVDLDLIDPLGPTDIGLSGDVTAPDGSFSVTITETIMVGFYELRLSPDPTGNLFPLTAPDIFLGGDTQVGSFTLQSGSRLSGRVVDEAGSGLELVDIDFHDPVSGLLIPTSADITDADGFFSVLVAPASYDIEFRTTIGTNGGPYVPVDLADVSLFGDVALGDVVFADGHPLLGRVLDESGSPLVGADIDVRNPLTGLAISTPGDNTDAAGNFIVNAPSGDWIIEIDPPAGLSLVPRFVETTVLPGTDTDLGDLELAGGVSFSGKTVNPTGQPVPDVDLDFVIAATQIEIPTAHDNANVSGDFDVQVEPEIYDVQFRPPFASGFAPVVLESISVTSDLGVGLVPLPIGRSLTGTVTDGGTPVPGCRVTLEIAGTGLGAYTFGNRTDASGAFAIRQVPGIYDVTVSPPAFVGISPVTFAGVDLLTDSVLNVDLAAPSPPPVALISCSATGPDTLITWTNGAGDYDAIEVSRGGSVVGIVDGSSESFAEFALPAGTHHYEVLPLRAGLSCTPATCSVDVPQIPTGVFLRGDANASGAIDIADAISILSFLFQGGAAPGCADAADVNDNGTVNIADAVVLLAHLFVGGVDPAAPYPHPGPDPTSDGLPACP
jgi:hypothetical protein